MNNSIRPGVEIPPSARRGPSLVNAGSARSIIRPAGNAFFAITIMGFSFWFFLAVPFASHRETYSWLAGALTQSFTDQFRFGLASTYRPLSVPVIFGLFKWLDP